MLGKGAMHWKECNQKMLGSRLNSVRGQQLNILEFYCSCQGAHKILVLLLEREKFPGVVYSVYVLISFKPCISSTISSL